MTKQCYFKVEEDFHQSVEDAEESAKDCVITNCYNMSNLADKDNYLCADSVICKKLPRCSFTKSAKIALHYLNNTLSYKNYSSSICVARKIDGMKEKLKNFWFDVRDCEKKYSSFLNKAVISGTCLSQVRCFCIIDFFSFQSPISCTVILYTFYTRNIISNFMKIKFSFKKIILTQDEILQ